MLSPGLVAAGAGARVPGVAPERLLQPADVAEAVRWIVGTPANVCPVEVELQPQRTPSGLREAAGPPARLTGTVLPAVTATRYVTPLREGGSLPGLMEADDLGTYVVKWRAAGQGVKVLVAEVVCGELARALDLPVPTLVTVDVAPELAVGEPDVEVQELLQRSAGRNLGLDYLPGRAGLRGRRRRRRSRASPAGCCGSTRWSATSTGPGATRTCCSGTGGCS